MKVLAWVKMFHKYLEVKKALSWQPLKESEETENDFLLIVLFMSIFLLYRELFKGRLDGYPETKQLVEKELDFFNHAAPELHTRLYVGDDMEDFVKRQTNNFNKVLEEIQEANPQPPTGFRILHWGLLAGRFMKLVKAIKLGDKSWNRSEITFAGIDLASIYKRNLVGKLDGYPETVKDMCDYWDLVGLTGITELKKCPDYPMTEGQVIEALGRVKKHLDEFEFAKEKGVN